MQIRPSIGRSHSEKIRKAVDLIKGNKKQDPGMMGVRKQDSSAHEWAPHALKKVELMPN